MTPGTPAFFIDVQCPLQLLPTPPSLRAAHGPSYRDARRRPVNSLIRLPTLREACGRDTMWLGRTYAAGTKTAIPRGMTSCVMEQCGACGEVSLQVAT